MDRRLKQIVKVVIGYPVAKGAGLCAGVYCKAKALMRSSTGRMHRERSGRNSR